MFDFIGDIHGHAGKLEELLEKLGYEITEKGYAHPERKVFFVGDYIDRGPKVKRTLRIVRNMVENGKAIALMGNHEYNALCFHAKKKAGGHLRKHSIANIIQHYETLRQFQNKQDDYEEYLEWFKTLPLYYETSTFRAVHACWDYKSIRFLQQKLFQSKLTDESIEQSIIKGSEFHDAIETILKGKEIRLPEGQFFKDEDLTLRKEIRIRWWEDPTILNYKQISVKLLAGIKETPIDPATLKSTDYYKENDLPVFFGHYWLEDNPMLYRDNICCLDYSVAKGRLLAAYRFDGERRLDVEKFVFV